MVKTLCFHCRGLRFHPGKGTKIPHDTQCDQKKKARKLIWDFLGGPVVESLPANAGDPGSIPGPGRSHIPWC